MKKKPPPSDGSQGQVNTSVGPTLVGDHAITAGRGKHKHVIGFQLDFSAPLDAQVAEDPAHYAVVRQVKHGNKRVSHRVAIKAVYDPATHSVQLLFKGRPKLTMGGRIVVSPQSSGGIAVSAATTIVILPGARGLVG